ncbi:MAG: hypothetical protein A2X46_11780 [Lentisphaerae bacterium GWF2_57_35]|nr:MAG: hypothetical protein A2X46_11780 [Lentisphaerae bacterium GWF2_57_35]
MKNKHQKIQRIDAIPFFLFLVLPLLGILIAGKPLSQYLEFPPLTQHVAHAGFSWGVFAFFCAFDLLFAGPVAFHLWRCRFQRPPESFHRFPWWGWLGVAITFGSWVLAWTRFEFFEPLQAFTFSPLWFGYILCVNALAYRRTGSCMLTHQRFYFILLFLVSAAFWWFFEYLNRFVQNWYYVGADDLSPFKYFVFATLPFSTVLPAVLGTYDLLNSAMAPPPATRFYGYLPVKSPPILPWTILLSACLGLAGIGIWPDLLFPLLWLSPLLILGAWQAIRREETILFNITPEKWHRICLLAVAALICGFFWELWNFHSYAKWIYTVPFVNRFHLFEMPLLGYAGYLPFGIECALIGDLIKTFAEKRKTSEGIAHG